jgi:hypothetical protein
MAKRASRSRRDAKPKRALGRGRPPAPPPIQPCGVPFPTVGLGVAPGPIFNPVVRAAAAAMADQNCIAAARARCLTNPLCPNPSFLQILLDLSLPAFGLTVHVVVALWVCVPPRVRPVPFPRRGPDGGFEG